MGAEHDAGSWHDGLLVPQNPSPPATRDETFRRLHLVGATAVERSVCGRSAIELSKERTRDAAHTRDVCATSGVAKGRCPRGPAGDVRRERGLGAAV